MATNANPLQMLGQAQPLPQAPAPPEFNIDDYDPAEPLGWEILGRPYRVKMESSRRLVNREKLLQIVQFIGPMVSNAQFVEQMAQQGKAADLVEFWRMVEDATGIERTYTLFRPMNAQETQARSQPAAAVQAQMQAKQAEGETRKEIMAMKQQGEKYKVDTQAQIKELEIREESAWKTLEQIVNEKIAIIGKPDPQTEQMLAQIKLQTEGQKMQLDREKHQMGLQAEMQKHQMGMASRAQQAQFSATAGEQSHQQKMRQTAESFLAGQEMRKQESKDKAAAEPRQSRAGGRDNRS